MNPDWAGLVAVLITLLTTINLLLTARLRKESTETHTQVTGTNPTAGLPGQLRAEDMTLKDQVSRIAAGLWEHIDTPAKEAHPETDERRKGR